jgi:hypothetical protein
MLTGTGEIGGSFGYSVALSADGSTALVGGNSDNGSKGAAWVFAATCQSPKQVCAHLPTPAPFPALTTTTNTTLPRPHVPVPHPRIK